MDRADGGYSVQDYGIALTILLLSRNSSIDIFTGRSGQKLLQKFFKY